jgi:hypothetical protein
LSGFGQVDMPGFSVLSGFGQVDMPKPMLEIALDAVAAFS